ncbi:hypothetical protein TRFO_12877 [Tritrichomonas foetus]|uniref:Uncharacterized protein n=1 Tax=Tritrichomonas foetus TaxID=1144522 RepID=A0A1J4KZX6_9EUKA|nr:hypothetical protein TRFO_12877 [Tritrichomonas foetus]|eukprot:OHT16807.1 hypothetical protein TRFO_12877 [Tritrichomonas foetus]
MNEIDEEKYPPQIYVNLTEPERELHSIRHLCFVKPLNALVLLNSVHRQAAISILSSLKKSLPPFQILGIHNFCSAAKFHWMCHIISLFMNFDSEIDVMPLYINELKEVNFNFTPQLLKMLQNSSILSSSSISSYSKSSSNQELIFASNSNSKSKSNSIGSSSTSMLSISPPSNSLTTKDFEAIVFLQINFSRLFLCFSKIFDSILEQIDINKVYSVYRYNLLSFMNLDKLDTSLVKFSNYEDIGTIIQFTLVKSSNFLKMLQNHFFTENFFPDRTFFGNNSILASLFNSSLAKKVHFIDIQSKLAFSFFQENENKQAIEAFSLFPQMQSWIVAEVFQSKSKNQNNYQFLQETLPLLQNFKANICTDFLNRCKNDFDLAIRINQATGEIVDFESKSLPLFFIHFLDKPDEMFEIIEEISKKELFIFSDENRLKDCDFLSYFFALINEINCFTHESDLENYLNHFRRFLYLINNKENIVNDLFSLIFLSVNDNFICKSNIAEKILIELSNFIHSESLVAIYQLSIKKVQLSNLLYKDFNLLHVLKPYYIMFNDSLFLHEWDVAKQIAQIEPKFKPFLTIFRSVIEFSENESIFHDRATTGYLENLIISSEIGLSYKNQSNFVEKSLELLKNNNNSFNELLKEVLMKRRTDKNANTDPLSLKIEPITINIQNICSKLSDLDLSEWIPSELDSNFSRHSLFSGFYSYLDEFIPIILHSKISGTISSILSKPPQNMLFELFNQKKFKEAEKVAASMKLDIIEALIIFSYNHHDLNLPMIGEYPIVTTANSLFSGNKIPQELSSSSSFLQKLNNVVEKNYYHRFTIPYQTLCEKTINNSFDSSIDEKMISDVSDLDFFENRSEVFFQKLLIKLIESNPMDIEKVADVSFKVSHQFFEDAIMKRIVNLDFNAVKQLINISNCSGTLEESINILYKVERAHQPLFPLDNSFKFLLSTGTFSLAKQLCANFRYQMKTSKIIREVALSLLYKEKSVIHVLNVCPQLKNEIIESLPSRYKEKVQTDSVEFFDTIPKSWRTFKEPKATFIRNLNNEEEAFYIFQKFPFINIDKELLSLFQPQSKCSILETVQFTNISLNKLIKFFRNPIEPCHLVCKQLIGFISQVNVNCSSDEEFVSSYIHKIYISLNDMKQIPCLHDEIIEGKPIRNRQHNHLLDLLPKICSYAHVLSEFVLSGVNSRFGFPYSFNNFDSNETATNLALACYKFDLPLIASHFIESWNLNLSPDYYSLILFRIGRFDEGMNFCEDRRNKKSMNTMNIVSNFVDVCSYPQLFNQDELNSLIEKINTFCFANHNNDSKIDIKDDIVIKADSEHDFYVNSLDRSIHQLIDQIDIDNIIKKKDQMLSLNINISESSLRTASRYMKNKAPLFMRVKKLVANGNFDKALKLVMNNQSDVQDKWNMFLEAVFVVSISYSYLAKMKVKINEFDPKLSFFGSFLERLLRFAIDNSMPYLKYELEMFLGRTDSAVVTLISLYTEFHLLSDLENALRAVTKDIMTRKNHTKTAPNVVSLDIIESYAKIIPLQLQFDKFVQKENIVDTAKLSLFNGRRQAESMVVFLFRQSNFSLALKIILTCNLNYNELSDTFCDVLSNECTLSMLKLVRGLEDAAPDDVFMFMINRILIRLFFVLEAKEYVIIIIEQALKNEEFKTKLFIQFGEYEKAFENAKKWKLHDLMPLIAHESIMKNASSQLSDTVRNYLTKLLRSTSQEFR